MPDDKREPVDWSGLTVGETVAIPRDLPWEAIGLRPPSGGTMYVSVGLGADCRVTVTKGDKDTITYSTGEQPRTPKPWRRRGKRGKP